MTPEMLAYYEKNTGRKYVPGRKILTPEEFKQLAAGLEVEYQSSMEKIDKSPVTIHHLNLTKQELKSDITSVRVEMKNLAKELRGEMSNLRQELRGEMAGLRQELKNEMASLRQAMSHLQMQMTNAVELLLQKMDETSAKLRVDIDLQRHYWDLAVDHYAPLREKSEDHEVRIQKLETSEF
jgi:paraquat-inducible protein B